MGVSAPTPPGDDPHAAASWTETPADVLLEQARAAVSGGDLPRARSLAESLRRREALSAADQADTWGLCLEIAVLDGEHGDADAAVDELAARLPIAQVRQRIRMVWVRHQADVSWEISLLARAEASAGAHAPPPAPEPEADGTLLGSRYRSRSAGDPGGNGAEPPPEGSVLRLLEAIGDDDDEDPGEPDRESVRLFTEGGPLYQPDELRGAVEGARAAALVREEEDDDGALPLLADTELAARSPDEIHRIVADHPGTSGRDLLRRYALEQARRTTPEELQHSYDMALEFFGQERYEEAAHLLLPVATVDNPERIGALELLARALLELGRIVQAEAYLKEAVPVDGRITDPSYAPLFYWLGRISEEKDDPGSAIEYYASAVKLAPDLVEAKRRLHVLLAL